jgi:HD-GYP domain-containing protein (c-di-GMP phosphodiesterase class II)
MWKPGPLARPLHAAHGAAARGRLAEPAGARRRGPAVGCLSPEGVNRLLAQRAPRMAAHQRAVAELTGVIARAIGLDGEELHAVVRAAELHDVGKIAVPDAILNKPGPLDDAELEIMRRHAVAGQHILAGFESAVVGRLVRASHERWDGSGYPDGLRGEEIPLGARIITICDSFDAMTHARPYRPARSVSEALAELRHGAGRRFDPALVAVFLSELGYLETRVTQ